MAQGPITRGYKKTPCDYSQKYYSRLFSTAQKYPAVILASRIFSVGQNYSLAYYRTLFSPPYHITHPHITPLHIDPPSICTQRISIAHKRRAYSPPTHMHPPHNPPYIVTFKAIAAHYPIRSDGGRSLPSGVRPGYISGVRPSWSLIRPSVAVSKPTVSGSRTVNRAVQSENWFPNGFNR